MANEARLNLSLYIKNGNLEFQNRPTAFLADVAGKKGPVPGAVAVSVDGVNVSFAELTTPSLCVLQNLDATNFVTYGIWNPAVLTFHPLGELLPGEVNIIRLSRYLGDTMVGTGTGPLSSSLRLEADTAACSVFVGAFEV